MTIENLNLVFSSDTLTVVSAKGDWVQSNPYNQGDIVQNLGSTYIAIQDVPAGENIYNTNYWQLLSQQGATGATGNGISSIVLNADYTLTINYTDGTSDTTTSIRGATGATGATGNGIAGAVLNPDYTLTLTFTDGTTYTTPSIRGATGATGPQGATGATGPQGPQGEQGIQGDTGNGISSAELNNDYTLTLNFTDGTSYTTPSIRGAKGDTGEVSQAEFEGVLPTETVSGAVANFIDGSDVIPAKSVLADINAVQSGSGTPAPGNIRPITGRTAVNAGVRGKNWFDSQDAIVGGSYTNMTFDKAHFLKAGTYTASISNIVNATSWRFCFKFFKADGTVIQNAVTNGVISFANVGIGFNDSYDNNNVCVSSTNNTDTYHPFTLTQDVFVCCRMGFGDVGNTTTLDYQIELGSTATAYEPYAGHDYEVQLGQTVYGGTLDIVSGVLTITHDYIASYNGESLPGEWISDRDEYAQGTTPTTGAEVVYEVASPTTVQLTGQQVALLTGTNNIWADSGDVSVTYKADIKKYIDKMIAAAINA